MKHQIKQDLVQKIVAARQQGRKSLIVTISHLDEPDKESAVEEVVVEQKLTASTSFSLGVLPSKTLIINLN